MLLIIPDDWQGRPAVVGLHLARMDLRVEAVTPGPSVCVDLFFGDVDGDSVNGATGANLLREPGDGSLRQPRVGLFSDLNVG